MDDGGRWWEWEWERVRGGGEIPTRIRKGLQMPMLSLCSRGRTCGNALG